MDNAKEKAKELVDKMYFAEDQDGFHSMNKYRAKQCALIAVDELKKSNPFEKDFLYNGNAYYWNEVKREIEKL
jgi:hypothetical protein